jgi:hypothetical protein
VIASAYLAYHVSKKDEEEQETCREYHSPQRQEASWNETNSNISRRNNNDDHAKRQYESREEAEEGYDGNGTLVTIASGLALAYLAYRVWKNDEEEPEARHEYHGLKREEHQCTSSNNSRRRHNNHDDEKRQYCSRQEAEEVITRMRMKGLDEYGTLRAYYNSDYGKWFVGNVKRL